MTAIRTALVAATLAGAAVALPANTPVVRAASVTGVAAEPVPATEHAPRTRAVVAEPAPSHGMFATPRDAMRYLVTAYNHHDLVALKHVTTPSAREALEEMRATANDLRLRSCTFREERGDYYCTFSHGFPASAHRTGRGHATFTVAPAAKPGWYMTVLDECN